MKMYGWFLEVDRALGKQKCALDMYYGMNDGNVHEAMKNGQDFIYLDHAYFKRSWNDGNFRLIRNGIHLTEVVPRPPDRFRQWGIDIKPWRRNGRNIAILEPSWRIAQKFGIDSWVDSIQFLLRGITSRKVLLRRKSDGYFVPWLEQNDIWACVSLCSVAAVEAAMLGYPVFTTKHCPAWPVSAGELKSIDNPEYKDREPWLASLSYATWNVEELPKMKLKDWRYECAS